MALSGRAKESEFDGAGAVQDFLFPEFDCPPPPTSSELTDEQIQAALESKRQTEEMLAALQDQEPEETALTYCRDPVQVRGGRWR